MLLYEIIKMLNNLFNVSFRIIQNDLIYYNFHTQGYKFIAAALENENICKSR